MFWCAHFMSCAPLSYHVFHSYETNKDGVLQRVSSLLSEIKSVSGSAIKCSAPPAPSAFSCILTTSFKAHDSQQVGVLYMW